ncbi:hypothetical protein FHR72_001118 [Mycolicibacterium iranicum]|uniref:Rad50/SbcC-type AAA domain-containing protein n=1 Tax=Mycolicibacterium iranicum TaxID=912594 RepID=A0A839Q5K0_MYCIR|nr:AAA family ATPase [Mycolicibacterium iranicum]MBB2989655.1 hypothetical protein [Mycolicibacterium iranicum]
MYITKVVGTAFGPFRGETLEFAPGLNVVHGPNEAGKSSWFNAIYTGLAGRRKYKGKGTAAETDYKNRHKPWSGSKWGVGLVVTLDDDRVLAIEQDLARGEWRITDGTTAKAFSDTGLLTEGSFDGTRFLGLNRQSARSTIFTGQADILRVRDDAGALQELLERAASTEAADATADVAIAWLKDRRREWVGVAHGRKPLGLALETLNTARAQAELRRDDRSELLEHIVNRQKLAAALVDARAKVDLANRLVKWQSVYELRGRVEKAVALSAGLAESSEADLTIDETKLAAAAKALVVFDDGADVAPLEGPTAADLQRQIDELPQMPEGDLEPRPDVIAAHGELVNAQTVLDTHMQAAPPEVPQTPPTTLSADELRTVADILASKPPDVDTAAVTEFQRTKEARAAQLEALQQGVDERNTAYQQVKADIDASVQRGAQAGELLALHNAERSAADEVIAATRRQSEYLGEALASQEIQAGVMAQEVALHQHQERVGAARARVLAESLEAEPEALKRIARAIDETGAALERAATHAERTTELRAIRDDRARVLFQLLGVEGHAEMAEGSVEQAIQLFFEYVEACKGRAEVAQLAARRPDLAETQAQRQQIEVRHQQALATREAQRRDVVELVAVVGLNAESAEGAADQLRQWVSEQEEKRAALTKRKTDVALLEQLLGGRGVRDLELDLATQTAYAGEEPDAPMPPDLNAFVTGAKDQHDRMINLDGQIKGRIQTLGSSLGSVAEAVEAEADALRAVTQVQTLQSCLDAASVELEKAKERANASIAPALANQMRPWLPRVTNGRYHDVSVDPADLTINVTERTGQVRRADRLSLGTTEQIYLLLRVTLSQVLSGGAETAPLIFDDVTTQSDNTRTVAVMELLHELSTEHQVILFTQEEEVVEWAQQNIEPPRDKTIALVAP